MEAESLKNRFNNSPLAGWDKAKDLRIEGPKLDEMIFTDFRWIEK